MSNANRMAVSITTAEAFFISPAKLRILNAALFLLNAGRSLGTVLIMPKKTEYVNALAAAILMQHECEPTYRETVFVEEKTDDNQIVWQGDVLVFDLSGHRNAKACYAWQHYDGDGDTKIFAILENELINSPKRAVQAAIFVDAQPSLHRVVKEMEQLKAQIDECRNSLRKIDIKAAGLIVSIHATRDIPELPRISP